MRTIIRLSNRGSRNHHLWWIVAQTSGKPNQGKCHEVLGYWLPRWTAMRQRAIILNKHRLRYWVESGADMSDKTQRLLAKGGMMPEAWISWGRAHNYEKKKTVGDYVNKIKQIQYFNRELPQHIYEGIEEQNRDVLVLKKLKEQSLVHNELMRKGVEQINVELDEDFQIEADEFLRAKQFYGMRDVIQQMDDNLIALNPSKRTLLQKKMNKMTSMGILSEEEVGEKETEELNLEDIQAHEVRTQQMMLRIEEAANAMEIISKDSYPMPRDEAVEFLIENLNEPPYKVQKFVSELYEIAEATGEVITRNDIKFHTYEFDFLDPEDKVNYASTVDEVLFPAKQFLTPVPDIAGLDPSDMYDMRDGPSKAIDPNAVGANWFTSPEKIDKARKQRNADVWKFNPRDWKSKKMYNIQHNKDPATKKYSYDRHLAQRKARGFDQDGN